MALQVATAAINALRDNHYVLNTVSGLNERSVLMEGSRTNSLLWSRDLTNAAWVKTGTGTAVLNALGFDGVGSSAATLTDTDAAVLTQWAQAVTVPVDTNTHTVSFYVTKDSDQTRFPFCYASITGGTTVQRGVHLNTQTGAVVATNIGGTTTSRVVDGGSYWMVEITVTNNSTASNTVLTAAFCPARSTVIGTDNAAATGSAIVHHIQAEINSAFVSSPIFTTTVAVTRGADSYSVPFTTPPQAMTVYTKFVERGTIKTNGSRILEVSNGSASNPRLVLFVAGSTYGLLQHNGVSSIQAVTGVAPAIGDTVELRGVLFADGSVQIGQTINGGAEAVPAAVSGISLPAAWSGTTLWLGNNGVGQSAFAAFLVPYKVALGVKTLAQMQAL